MYVRIDVAREFKYEFDGKIEVETTVATGSQCKVDIDSECKGHVEIECNVYVEIEIKVTHEIEVETDVWRGLFLRPRVGLILKWRLIDFSGEVDIETKIYAQC